MATIAAVGLAHHEHGGHCGVYYEAGPDKSIRLLHLGWQDKLWSDEPTEYYKDIPSRFPQREQMAVSDFCRLVYHRHGSKGLRFATTRNDGFLPDGGLKLDEPGTGFSCATFVKAIFETVRLPLVQDKTWPVADDNDRKWFQGHVDAMERHLSDKPAVVQHLAAIDVSCNWSRYLPEQIAYAASIAPPPATYKAVKKNAKILMRSVVQSRKPLPPREG